MSTHGEHQPDAGPDPGVYPDEPCHEQSIALLADHSKDIPLRPLVSAHGHRYGNASISGRGQTFMGDVHYHYYNHEDERRLQIRQTGLSWLSSWLRRSTSDKGQSGSTYDQTGQHQHMGTASTYASEGKLPLLNPRFTQSTTSVQASHDAVDSPCVPESSSQTGPLDAMLMDRAQSPRSMGQED